MAESAIQRPLMQEMIHADDGLGRVGALVAAGALALTAVVGYTIKDNLPGFPGLPGYKAAPEDSDLKVRQLELQKRTNHCLTLGAWDAAGTVGRLDLTAPGGDRLLGKGVVVHELKPIDETCLDGSRITITDGEVDGKAVKIVSVERKDFRRDVKFRPEDTVLEVTSDPLDQLKDGAIDIFGSFGRLGCSAVNEFKEDDFDCESVNRFGQANRLSDEALKQGMIAEIEEAVRVEGGQQSWPETRELFGEVYQDQAEQEGLPRDSVVFQVTENGKPTDQPPDFDKSIEQELIDEGLLREEVENVQQLKFEKRLIVPLPSEEEARKQ